MSYKKLFKDNPNLAPPVEVKTDAQLAKMMDAFAGQDAIAVDTESNSLYAYYERICLIQLSGRETDYIVDPLADLDLAPLGDLFADPGVEKVFHAAEQDVAGMKRDFGFQFANLFDTMWAARILGWSSLGLAKLLWEYFEVRTDKRYQRHNWQKRPIEPGALAYARLDTHYLPALRDIQIEALNGARRLEEAREVFAQLAVTDAAEIPFGPDAFWRVKGLYDLSDREQAILWELYLWRDREASRRDRPPFKVVGDRTLIQLAQRAPHSRRGMQGVYGIKDYHIRRYGSQIIEAVERGKHTDPPQPPASPQPTDEEVQRFRALRSWRKRTAARRDVNSDVILPKDVMWTLAEENPSDHSDLEEIEGLGPWRRKTYGSAILRVIRSERSRSRRKKSSKED
jgi:ribonuclease D